MEFFKGIQLYLKDTDTGLLEIKFICKTCGKVMDEPEHCFTTCSIGGIPLYHKMQFYCKDCYERRTNNG